MNKGLSVYLDILRVLAAVTVFLAHLSALRYSGGFLWQLQHCGHPAVIVFFVLSGYLIQYSVTARENRLVDYAAARFSRLYSVAIPALLLTFVLDRLGVAHDPDTYVASYQTYPLMRIAAGALFLNESWGSVQIFSNLPFWSLPYEFWYYALFGAVIFLRGWKRGLAALVCALIAGPAILLLFPIWLCGVYAFRASAGGWVRPSWAAAIFAATLVLSLILVAVAYGMFDGWFARYRLGFLTLDIAPVDFLLGPVLAVNLAAAAQLRLPLAALERPVKYLAGMTFTLYLFHAPLIHFAAGFFLSVRENWVRAGAITLIIFAVVWLLSLVTEHKRYLWNRLFRRLLAPLGQDQNHVAQSSTRG